MTKHIPTDFFTKDLAQVYDERNSNLSAISENMHFLIRLVLKSIPENSRILCVGVGTGAEILALAKIYPTWTFVGLDPSASMLEVCRDRLYKAGILNRCELIHGYVQDITQQETFNATLSILVGHFVKIEQRLDFYKTMIHLLKPNGYFITTEISYDLNSIEFPLMLKNWEQIQTLMGATAESLANLPKQLKEVLTILPGTEVESFIRQSGIQAPVRFFQSFMISGWYGIKNRP